MGNEAGAEMEETGEMGGGGGKRMRRRDETRRGEKEQVRMRCGGDGVRGMVT